MSTGLNLPQNGTLDFVALGASNHRVDSGIIPFRKATQWNVYPSGGEYNVAANLADCFRLRTGMVSATVYSDQGHGMRAPVVFYGLLAGEAPEQAVKLGWAHGALMITFPGDSTMATLEQVRAFARGDSARIQR